MNGVHIGTSLNSIGNTMAGTNSECKETVEEIRSELNLYLSGEKMHINGEKVRCKTFTL